MKQLLLVGFGGFIGSIARYLVSRLNLTWNFHSIPMGTLTVNIAGSLLIGFMLGIFINSNLLHSNLRLFLVVGFCGGFTTFSTYLLDFAVLCEKDSFFEASLYLLLSVAAGLAVLYAGMKTGAFVCGG